MSCLADKESFEECEGGSYPPWKYEAQVSSLWAHQSGYKRSPVSSSTCIFTFILFMPYFQVAWFSGTSTPEFVWWGLLFSWRTARLTLVYVFQIPCWWRGFLEVCNWLLSGNVRVYHSPSVTSLSSSWQSAATQLPPHRGVQNCGRSEILKAFEWEADHSSSESHLSASKRSWGGHSPGLIEACRNFEFECKFYLCLHSLLKSWVHFDVHPLMWWFEFSMSDLSYKLVLNKSWR